MLPHHTAVPELHLPTPHTSGHETTMQQNWIDPVDPMGILGRTADPFLVHNQQPYNSKRSMPIFKCGTANIVHVELKEKKERKRNSLNKNKQEEKETVQTNKTTRNYLTIEI
jgi:hypothetical protein